MERTWPSVADPRVHQFTDPGRHAGLAFARAAYPGFKAPAWDVYLFFDAGARWGSGDPPAPAARLAQFLGPDGAFLVASDVDARNKPISLGSGDRLGALMAERMVQLDGAASGPGGSARPRQ